MILRSLRVEGWRCFANPLEIGPLREGLNVIHGPNGCGKSTLMQAIVCGFFDNHRVSGGKVDALRPWGRDLSPVVTIEFEHRSERLRLRKRLLNSAGTELSREEQGKFVRLAEDDAADQRLRDLLAAEAPSRGLSKMSQWGFAQVLWAPQRGMQLEPLSAGMTQAIQSALGAQVGGAGSGAVEKKIEDLYLRIYTPQGKLLGGAKAPPVVALQTELAEADKLRRELAVKLEAFDDAARRIEDLKSRQLQAQHGAEQQEHEVHKARRCAEQYLAVRSVRDRQAAEVLAADARYQELRQRIEQVGAARREQIEAKQALARLEEDVPLLERQARQAQQALDEAARALTEVRARRAAVEEAEKTAQRAALWTDTQRERLALQELLGRVADVRAELDAREKERAGVVAPDAKALKAIATAVKRRDTAQVRLDAAMIAISIEAEAPLTIDAKTCESPGEKPLAAGGACRLKGSPEVVFRLPGVAVIRATGPSGSADELRAELAAAETAVERLTAGFGTRDLDALERVHAKSRELDAELEKRRERLDTLLAGRRPQDLQQEQSRLEKCLAELSAAHTDWQQSPPDARALANAARQTKEKFIEAVDAAEASKDKAQSAAALASQQQAVQGGRLKAAEQASEAADQRLARLTAGMEDEAASRDRLQKLLMQWDAAKVKLEEAETQLRQYGADPCKEVELLEGRLKAQREQSAQLSAELNRAQGRLDTLAAEAPYSALAESEERVERLRAEVARHTLRNEAIRLLRTTVAACKQQAVEAVVGPVEQRATQTLQRIAGTRLGHLRFSDGFSPQHVAPATAGAQVSIDELAGGEQEQVHFAVRLALAEVLFDGERQPIIFDDALTYTDAARMARVLRILDESQARFQILVFTCHPERYRGLPDVPFWNLETLSAAGG